jgi:ATP-dependent helicase HrpB
MPFDLPIDAVLAPIRAALAQQRNLVLQAPPGAGKSTRVPLELLEEEWVGRRRIIMLEPRRLATRAVAQRMATTLGESVGRTVGYRMRLDTRVSAATRIEVVTEGVLATLLQQDPALEDVACVIFDEFHERSLQADLGLALCLDVQANLHEDLRILVMSATLEAEPVGRLLGDAAIVRATGRSHPVEVQHAAARRNQGREGPSLARDVVGAVRRTLEREGDVLVFLPGAAEIRRADEALREAALASNLLIAPLYGDLAAADQERALEPAPRGMRKVVLATNIAETSLTIEGVRSVVDSGLERRARFDPVSGMSRLETRRISRASAEQRAGRAGRLAPGLCLRLWSESEQRSLEEHAPAEILEADLAPLALELAGWNLQDATRLAWLDPPPAAAMAQARELLGRLAALESSGRITAHGRAMLQLRMHPRLAHMLLRARELDRVPLACDLAALLGERDIVRLPAGERDSDLRVRLDAVRGLSLDGQGTDRAGRERVRRSAGQYRRQMGVANEPARNYADDDVGILLAFAYPDRIASARPERSGRYLLSNGRGAAFSGPQALARAEFLVVAELDAGEREARIHLAAPLSRDALERHFASEITSQERVYWEPRERAVVASHERRLGALTLENRALAKPDPQAVTTAMLEGIRALSIAALPWDRDTREWQARVMFVRALPAERDAGWPDVSDAALATSLESWLGSWLAGMSRADHLARLDLRGALQALLDWKLRQRLDALAPMHLEVPSGSRIRLDYQAGDIPALAVRLQEVFGWGETPRIGGGAVAVLLKLLSPAQRPVQVTRDLASFWRGGYQEVRKELKGRYPKHYWPEDPLQAQARRGTRPARR